MAPKRRPVPIPGPSPMMRHEVKRARLSASPSSANAVRTLAPPSTMRLRTPSSARDDSTASRSTLPSRAGTLRTRAPAAVSASALTGSSQQVKIRQPPDPVTTFAETGVDRRESSTTRRGLSPSASRTVNSGSSCSTVPTPTMTAS